MDATGWPGGGSRLLALLSDPPNKKATSVSYHGASPWHLCSSIAMLASLVLANSITQRAPKLRNLAAFTRLSRRVDRPAVLRLGRLWVPATAARFNGLKWPDLARRTPDVKDAQAPSRKIFVTCTSPKRAGLITLRGSVNATGCDPGVPLFTTHYTSCQRQPPRGKSVA